MSLSQKEVDMKKRVLENKKTPNSDLKNISHEDPFSLLVALYGNPRHRLAPPSNLNEKEMTRFNLLRMALRHIWKTERLLQDLNQSGSD